jgi:hypothetical protein
MEIGRFFRGFTHEELFRKTFLASHKRRRNEFEI